MKHFSILIFSTLIIFSCCSTKSKAANQTKKTNNLDVAVVTEVPDITDMTLTSEKEEEEIEIEPVIKTPLPTELSESKKIKKFNHNRWNALLQKNVSETGGVNYEAFRKSRTELDAYINNLTSNVPNENWSKQETLAFWINAYNALTIDLILRNYPTKSIKDIKDPWDQRLWKFGKKWYNLNDIEHEILRKMDEPRIHFAIVCASVSCPKLQNTAFTAENLEAQLNNATKQFLKDKTRNEISKDELRLSKIFKWFKKDFEQNGSLVDFLNEYSDIAISQSAKVRYKDYNWDLNN